MSEYDALSPEEKALIDEVAEWSPYKRAGVMRAFNPDWQRKNAEQLAKLHANPAQQLKRIKTLGHEKRSAISKKMWDDPEYRKKMMMAMEKYKRTPEYLEKLSIGVKNSYTAELKSKRSAQKSIAVVCVETGMIFKSGIAASRNHGTESSGYICTAIRGRKGKLMTAYGHHWRYATPEESAYFWAERERTGTDGPFTLPVAPRV